MEDEPFLLQLYCDTRAEEISSWPMSDEQKSFLLQMQYNAQKHQFDQPFSYRKYDIIWHEGQRIGRFIVDRQEEGWRIVDISLISSMQYKGFGSKLISELQNEAVSQNKTIALSVLLSNPAARLYERLGFVEQGRNEVYMGMIYVPFQ